MKRRDFTRSFGRTYDGPRMRNPFFGAQEASPLTKRVMLGVAVAVVMGGVGLFFYAPFMQYADVRVSGLTTLSTDDVAARANDVLNRHALLVLPGAHIFFGNADDVSGALSDTFHFATLDVHREGRTLVVDAQERITEIAWTTLGKTYFVDLSGIASREATPEAIAAIAARRAHLAEIPSAPGVQPTMPIIDIRDGAEIALGDVVIDPNRLAHILALDAALRGRSLAPIAYTLDTPKEPWLTVSVLGSPSLLVDITVDPENPLLMYDAFVHGRGGNIATLEYIDLRFGNHVYSKEK